MAVPDAVRALERDLRGIFGSRLRSLAIYGPRGDAHGTHVGGHGHAAHPITTLALVESMTLDDLRSASRRIEAWHDAGLATPLLVQTGELERSLDVFPLELSAILADHVVVSGDDWLGSLAVDAADVRRACEVQARSHLLHLREGFLETRGRADALSVLILQSAPAFAALVSSLARLDGQKPADVLAAARHVERMLGMAGVDAAANGVTSEVVKLVHAHDLGSADAERLFAPYIAIVEKLVNYVDGWGRE
jgi:hypothetical protein